MPLPAHMKAKGHPPTPGAGRPRSLRSALEARFGPNAEQAWDVLEKIMNGQLETVQEYVRNDGQIIEIVRRPTVAERKEAAETIIAYTEGKPRQQVVVEASGDIKKASDEALEERVVGILANFAARAEARRKELEKENAVTVEPAALPEHKE